MRLTGADLAHARARAGPLPGGAPTWQAAGWEPLPITWGQQGLRWCVYVRDCGVLTRDPARECLEHGRERRRFAAVQKLCRTLWESC